MEESKKDKFNRLSKERMGKFKNFMRLFGNFANKCNYDYTDRQAKELIKEMRNEVDILEEILLRKRRGNFKM